MSFITAITRGGTPYTPQFVSELRQINCIGCGRCFKVCPRDVFELIEREGSLGSLNSDDDGDDDPYSDDDDDGFADDTAMVMSLKNPLDCIGCEACSRICPKNCFSHQPLTA
ncbi:MAG: ferredoxin III, nif-specific [Gammaproteobacteria bacterium]|nr:ferredoxin III, nif-specific [Gammaproteobacteria bacterium]